MLEAQKLEADRRSQKQDEQMTTLQTQVNQLFLGAGPTLATSVQSQPALLLHHLPQPLPSQPLHPKWWQVQLPG